MRIPVKHIPQEIINEYNALPLSNNGFLWFEITNVIYGLTQVRRLANKLPTKQLSNMDFPNKTHPKTVAPQNMPNKCFAVCWRIWNWLHKQGRQKYLIKSIKKNYEVVAEDWNGNLFFGISLNWNYQDRTVDLCIPGYIGKVLQKFQHKNPTKSVNQPYKHTKATSGAKKQLV